MDYVTRYGENVERAVSDGGPVPRYTLTEGFDLGVPAEAIVETLTAMKANRPAVLRGMCDANFYQDVGAAMKEWLFNIYIQQS